MAGGDGLVALGGLLQTATDAYRAAESQRVDEVKRLRAELEAQREKSRAELAEQVAAVRQELSAEVQGLRSAVFGAALLKFTLLDLAGFWFETGTNSRLRVSESGACVYDSGQERQVEARDGVLVLDGQLSLSIEKSSRRTLVWEANSSGADAGAAEGAARHQGPVHWVLEVPGFSRQVTLSLHVGDVLLGREGVDERGNAVTQRFFSYRFSLMGCEVKLMLGRNSRAEDGSYGCGDEELGVYFGLLKCTEPGESRHGVDAVSCRALVELWDAATSSWSFLVRTVIYRFSSDSAGYGTHAALPLPRFREIVESAPAPAGGDRERTARFRVTLTDVGMLELSAPQGQAIRPS